MSIRPRSAVLNPQLQRPSALKSVPRDPSYIWLDKNENLDPVQMQLAHEVLRSIPALTLATYPESGELYRKLAQWVGVAPEQLLLTPGSDGAIALTFDTFVEDGDAVIHTEPTFAMYTVYAQMFGARAIAVNYTRRNDAPVLDVDLIFAALREQRPKLLCLPNPDSPTGTTLNAEILRKLLNACEAAGTVLLLDEAYHPFHDWTAAAWTAQSRNLVLARTFAKAWGCAGLRIGYAVGHPETIALMHKLRPMYEVGSLSVEFMSRMLDHPQAMQASVQRTNEGKAWFLDEMRALGYAVLPTAGNFLHVNFGAHGKAIHAALAARVYYRADFGHPCLAGYSRFTAAPRAVMAPVVDLIKQSLKAKS